MREKESIPVCPTAIESVKMIHSGKGAQALLGGRNGKVMLVQLSNDLINDKSRLVKAYEGHRKRVTDVEYSASANRIISVSADQHLAIWDAETKSCNAVQGHNRAITAVALNGQSNKIVTASQDASFILWNVEGKQIAVFGKGIENGHREWINAVGFVPNSEDLLITASEDSTVKLWDLELGTLLKTFCKGNFVDYAKARETKTAVHDYDIEAAVKCISFSKDGSMLAYGCRNGKIYLVNLATNQTLQTIDVADKVIAIAAGETQPLIAISVPNKILLWNIIESKIIATYEFATKGEHYCRSLVFSGDEVLAGLDNGVLLRLEVIRN